MVGDEWFIWLRVSSSGLWWNFVGGIDGDSWWWLMMVGNIVRLNYTFTHYFPPSPKLDPKKILFGIDIDVLIMYALSSEESPVKKVTTTHFLFIV